MRIVLLGTSAGGGLPQWNCACQNCRAVRMGRPGIVARTQSSVAISADEKRWFLLNASPDLPRQFASFSPLHPPRKSGRSTGVEAVLLTNADLDHTLGLLALREGEPLRVCATLPVRRSLTSGISIAPALGCFCGLRWIKPPERLSPLLHRDGSQSGLKYQAIALAGTAPRFVRARGSRIGSGHSIGYRIVDERTQGRLLFLPDVAQIDRILAAELSEADVILFDGTFWSENEMRSTGVGRITAKQMGHMPISGPKGSLKHLAALPARRKIYIHINNTNPILQNDSGESACIRAAAVEVGLDGMEICV